MVQWRIQGRGPEGPGPPLIFRPNWGPKGQKTIFFRPPPILSQGVDDRPPPPPPPPPPPHNVPGLTLIIHNFETNKQNSTNPDIFVKFDRINSLDPPLWCLTFLCPGGNITDPQISLTHVTVEKPKVYSRPTSVRQT